MGLGSENIRYRRCAVVWREFKASLGGGGSDGRIVIVCSKSQETRPGRVKDKGNQTRMCVC